MARSSTPARPRSGVPWWTPLLGLLALVVVTVVLAVALRGTSSGASTTEPARTANGVLGTTHTTRAPVKNGVTPAVRSTGLAPGRRAAEHSVRVLAVVGPRIFWIGTRSRRTLVHLQGPGTRWSIRPGQRLTFIAAVTKNNARVAAAWGLSRREGRDAFSHQPTHFEVYGLRIRFLCVQRCSR